MLLCLRQTLSLPSQVLFLQDSYPLLHPLLEGKPLDPQLLKQLQVLWQTFFDFISISSFLSLAFLFVFKIRNFYFLIEQPQSSLFHHGSRPSVALFAYNQLLSFFLSSSLSFSHVFVIWELCGNLQDVAILCQLCDFFLHPFQTFLGITMVSQACLLLSIYYMSARRCLSASTSLQGYGRLSLSCLVQASFCCSICLWRDCISFSCRSSLVTNSIPLFPSQALCFSVLWSFTLSLLFFNRTIFFLSFLANLRAPKHLWLSALSFMSSMFGWLIQSNNSFWGCRLQWCGSDESCLRGFQRGCRIQQTQSCFCINV